MSQLCVIVCVIVCVCVCVCVRGYYPKGGGEVVATVNPVKELQPINMTERGTITKIYGRAFVAGVLPFKVRFLLLTHTLCQSLQKQKIVYFENHLLGR